MVVIPFFLFLSAIFPQTHSLFVVGWLLCLSFDVHSTYRFYLENPGQFRSNERNKLFVWLTEKFGFKKATLLFPIVLEIPLLLFFAMLPLQILQINLFPNTPNQLFACITASFGISAIGHLQAAIKNTKYNNSHKTKPTHLLPARIATV
jgi:Gpi18-like mannosyltransferase